MKTESEFCAVNYLEMVFILLEVISKNLTLEHEKAQTHIKWEPWSVCLPMRLQKLLAKTTQN